MVHYDLSGPEKGELVVLVHGNAAPYFSWDNNLKTLTGAGFRVVRYDLYGFGYLDRPDVTYSRELYDRQLSEMLAKPDIKGPVNMVGTSQGGSIAVYFAAKHPERVKRARLSNLRGDSLADFTPQYKTVGKSKIPVLPTWGTADIVIMADSIANIRKAVSGLEY